MALLFVLCCMFLLFAPRVFVTLMTHWLRHAQLERDVHRRRRRQQWDISHQKRESPLAGEPPRGGAWKGLDLNRKA